jgi:hypothetical protein
LGAIPSVLLLAIAVVFGQKTSLIFTLGALSVGLTAFLVWYGREAQRGAFIGLVSGVAPLLLSLCANSMHHCGGDECSSLCVPACTAGGVIAGAFVGGIGARRNARAGYYSSAISLSLLVGAMGCACMGYSGVFGLFAGFLVGSSPSTVRRVLA